MNVFRRKYFIYPEIQKPILVQIVGGFLALCLIQAVCIYFSFHWLEQTTKVNLNILVDARVLGPWKNLMLLAICVPLVMNLFFSIIVSLYVSNKFAGPIYRIEKEIDDSINMLKQQFEISRQAELQYFDIKLIKESCNVIQQLFCKSQESLEKNKDDSKKDSVRYEIHRINESLTA